MKTFTVTIPVAGHITFEVEAENEADAIKIGMNMDVSLGDLEWDTLRQFHEGNFCYCPEPWEAEAVEID